MTKPIDTAERETELAHLEALVRKLKPAPKEGEAVSLEAALKYTLKVEQPRAPADSESSPASVTE